MKGLVSCNNLVMPVSNGEVKPGDEQYKQKEWERMREHGLMPDEANDLYYLEGYGAYMGNIDAEISEVEDLFAYIAKGTDQNPYEFYRDYATEGYLLTIGPGAPADNGIVSGKAVYCENYLDLLKTKN